MLKKPRPWYVPATFRPRHRWCCGNWLGGLSQPRRVAELLRFFGEAHPPSFQRKARQHGGRGGVKLRAHLSHNAHHLPLKEHWPSRVALVSHAGKRERAPPATRKGSRRHRPEGTFQPGEADQRDGLAAADGRRLVEVQGLKIGRNLPFNQQRGKPGRIPSFQPQHTGAEGAVRRREKHHVGLLVSLNDMRGRHNVGVVLFQFHDDAGARSASCPPPAR